MLPLVSKNSKQPTSIKTLLYVTSKEYGKRLKIGKEKVTSKSRFVEDVDFDGYHTIKETILN